jgi:hypothetical protein
MARNRRTPARHRAPNRAADRAATPQRQFTARARDGRTRSRAWRGRGVGRVPSRDLACVFRRRRRYRGYRDRRAVCHRCGGDRSRDPLGPGIPLLCARNRRIDARGERRGRHGRSGLRLGGIASDQRYDGTATSHRDAAAIARRALPAPTLGPTTRRPWSELSRPPITRARLPGSPPSSRSD